jgi:hypothetical protein
MVVSFDSATPGPIVATDGILAASYRTSDGHTLA